MQLRYIGLTIYSLCIYDRSVAGHANYLKQYIRLLAVHSVQEDRRQQHRRTKYTLFSLRKKQLGPFLLYQPSNF